jgi:hypothetical protein
VASNRLKKNVWQPTASYYERFAKSRQNRHNDVTLYDVSKATPMGTDFDYITVSGNSLGNDSCVLVPGEPKPVVACYKTPGLNRASGNEII